MPTTTLTAHLDHVIVMLDPDAYRDVLASALLPGFSRFSVKESESSLAGRYSCATVVGHSTMVELFDVTAPPLPDVTGGLVLSFEEPGSSAAARDALTAAGVPFTYELVERQVEGESGMRPWYHLIRPELGPDNPFLLMVAEVTTEYYAHIGAVSEDGSLSRAGYLDAQLGGAPPPDLPMGDVTAIALRLRADLADRLARTLTALGWEQTAADELVGPGVSIRLARGEPSGVTRVRVSASEVDSATESYGGSSVLDVRGGEADWHFTPAGA
ncbi:DUF5829 family protein [Actinophytocola sp. KF-1]